MTEEEIGKQRMKEKERWADKMETKFPITENVGPQVFASLQTFLPTKYNNNLTSKSVPIKRSKTCQFGGVMRRHMLLKIVT